MARRHGSTAAPEPESNLPESAHRAGGRGPVLPARGPARSAGSSLVPETSRTMRLFALRAYSHVPGASTSLPPFEDAALLQRSRALCRAPAGRSARAGTTEVESLPAPARSLASTRRRPEPGPRRSRPDDPRAKDPLGCSMVGTTSEVDGAPPRPSRRRIRLRRRGRPAVPPMLLDGALHLAAFRPALLVARFARLFRGTRPLPDIPALVAPFHALRLGGRRNDI